MMIRIAILKKVGTENFKLFVKKEAKDLITFKTDIYLKDAQNDPFKKANVITEVVESISKIPDAIARSLFYKKTSEILGVPEQTLIFEGNKFLLKKGLENNRIATANNNPYQENLLNDEEEIEGEEIESGSKHKNLISYQEEESVRLLLSYAGDWMEEDLSVINYFMRETEKIEFETPIYKEFIEIFRKAYNSGQILDSKFFIHHTNAEIQSEAIRLLSNQYSFSENWELAHKIIIPVEEDIYVNAVNSNMLRLKQRKIQKLLNEVISKLPTINDIDEEIKYLKIYKGMKSIEVENCKNSRKCIEIGKDNYNNLVKK